MTAAGCPYPPPLDVEDSDAGASSPPVILRASPPEFRFPGPITLRRTNEDRVFAIDISDNDLEDLLFVRMYVDYGREIGPDMEPEATPPLSDCTASTNNETVRTASCPAALLCSTLPPADTEAHALEVLVADREFLPAGDPAAAGQPAFRAISPGGSPAAIRSWVMRCEP
jgi:hypothetical protein